MSNSYPRISMLFMSSCLFLLSWQNVINTIHFLIQPVLSNFHASIIQSLLRFPFVENGIWKINNKVNEIKTYQHVSWALTPKEDHVCHKHRAARMPDCSGLRLAWEVENGFLLYRFHIQGAWQRYRLPNSSAVGYGTNLVVGSGEVFQVSKTI